MKTRLAILLLGVCATATPAMAGLFDFDYDDPGSAYYYATGEFYMGADTLTPSLTSGSVSSQVAPEVANFINTMWGAGGDLSNFWMAMTITNITASTADGAGTFTIIDFNGDTITGNLEGDWSPSGPSNSFVGTLSNVMWNNESGDNTFQGHISSVSMSLFPPDTWSGAINLLSTPRTPIWFDDSLDYHAKSGSVDASVVSTPMPAAVILGMLGLGVAGWKLRRFA